MHDVLGVRIITFFPDEVDKVADVVAREFDIDDENSIDKRATHAPEEFGYMSLHYVARLNEARATLSENARFKGLPFEVQIRSILQHAWAEIEHDLGYKTKSSIPPDSHRRFSRLAASLEGADEQFKVIRDELAEYQRELPAAIRRVPATVDINGDSVLALAAEDPGDEARPPAAGVSPRRSNAPIAGRRRLCTRERSGRRASGTSKK
jgi:ppGpp synthetase/RelA/SpoT-type nucleotidyltranferase